MATDDSEVFETQASELAEREFVRLLISEYREHPHLWDVKNVHYTNKIKRTESLLEICETLRAFKPDYTIEDLKRKINILRTNFNKERHKIESRKPIEGENEPCLWYYYDLLFLAGQTRVPSKRDVSSTPSSSSIKRRKIRKELLNHEPSSSSSIRTHDSEADLLVKCWTMKLQRLAPDQRLYAEKIINDTLFEAAMGNLTRHGVTFASPPSYVECSIESNPSSPKRGE